MFYGYRYTDSTIFVRLSETGFETPSHAPETSVSSSLVPVRGDPLSDGSGTACSSLDLQVRVGWAYDARAFACPQPLRTRVLREDPAHVPGTNSGFRVHVLQTHRLEQGLVLVVGRGGARRAWVRRILGERTAHRAARSAPMAWALRARAPAAARPRRVTSWVGCHASAKICRG